jgi:hypothetical protein
MTVLIPDMSESTDSETQVLFPEARRIERRRHFIVASMASVLLSMAFGLNSLAAAAAAKTGYGLPVGTVRGCPAKNFDSSSLPLIVMLVKNGKPDAWYNISDDPGTNTYHFDVHQGRYQILTTYTGTQSHWITVVTGRSVRTDLTIKCSTYGR